MSARKLKRRTPVQQSWIARLNPLDLKVQIPRESGANLAEVRKPTELAREGDLRQPAEATLTLAPRALIPGPQAGTREELWNQKGWEDRRAGTPEPAFFPNDRICS